MKNQRTEPLKGSPVQESKPKEAKLTPGSLIQKLPPSPRPRLRKGWWLIVWQMSRFRLMWELWVDRLVEVPGPTGVWEELLV